MMLLCFLKFESINCNFMEKSDQYSIKTILFCASRKNESHTGSKINEGE